MVDDLKLKLHLSAIATTFTAAATSLLVISIWPGQPPHLRPILLTTVFLCLFAAGCHLWPGRCRIATAGPGLFYGMLAALTLLLFFLDSTLDEEYEHYSPNLLLIFGFALVVIISSGIVVEVKLAIGLVLTLCLTIAFTVFYGHLGQVEEMMIVVMTGAGVLVFGNAAMWVIAWRWINQRQELAWQKRKMEEAVVKQNSLTGKVRCIRYYGNNFAKFKIDTQRGVLPCRVNRLLLEVADIENNSDIEIPAYGLYQHEVKEDEMYILAEKLLLAKNKGS